MTEPLDPYYLWLGIPPDEQAANYYRLLGIRLFENNPEVIENAADRQMAHLRNFQLGQYADLSQTLLNEVAAAKVCLVQPQKKAAYDQKLRRRIAVDMGETAEPAAAVAPGRVAPPRAVAPPPVALIQPEPFSASTIDLATRWSSCRGRGRRIGVISFWTTWR
jgi:hypothetical protein